MRFCFEALIETNTTTQMNFDFDAWFWTYGPFILKLCACARLLTHYLSPTHMHACPYVIPFFHLSLHLIVYSIRSALQWPALQMGQFTARRKLVTSKIYFHIWFISWTLREDGSLLTLFSDATGFCVPGNGALVAISELSQIRSANARRYCCNTSIVSQEYRISTKIGC